MLSVTYNWWLHSSVGLQETVVGFLKLLIVLKCPCDANKKWKNDCETFLSVSESGLNPWMLRRPAQLEYKARLPELICVTICPCWSLVLTGISECLYSLWPASSSLGLVLGRDNSKKRLPWTSLGISLRRDTNKKVYSKAVNQLHLFLSFHCMISLHNRVMMVRASGIDYKLTTQEVVDDGVCCTVGIYEPMWESEPSIHCFSIICVFEGPKDSAGKVWHSISQIFLDFCIKLRLFNTFYFIRTLENKQ